MALGEKHLRMGVRDALDVISAPALIHDKDGRVVRLNRRARRVLDQLHSETTSPTVVQLFPASCFNPWKEYWDSLSEASREVSVSWQRGDALMHAQLSVVAASLDGEACGLVVFDRIRRTPNKGGPLRSEAGESLMDRRSIDGSDTAYFCLRAEQSSEGDVLDFTFVDVNASGCRQLSTSRQRLLGGSIKELFPINEEGGFFAMYRDAYLRQAGFRQEYSIPEGEPASGWYSQEVVPIPDGVGIFNHEISELKNTQEWLRQALEALPEPVFIADVRGRITQLNAAAARVFQYHPQELIGESVKRLMPRAHAQNHDNYMADYLRMGFAKMIGRPRELTAVNKSGEEFPIRLAVSEMHVGSVKAFVGSVYDLRELRALEVELRQTQKMEALGRLAGGVAHDFNNLLVVINQNAQMLQDAPEAPDNDGLVAEIREAGRRAAELSKQLLQFSRRELGKPRSVEAWAAVEGVASMARRLLPETHRLQIEAPEEPIFITIDPIQLEQVLLNLIINARDAMPSGGQMILRVRKEERGPSGASLLFELQDEGDGIPPEILSRIFDPFFTTKERGRGTGLGLSTVFGIVDRAGGRVDVESELGRGALFSVRFPISEPSVQEECPPNPQSRGRASLWVALVEDDPLVRSSTRRWLTLQGHRVQDFESGDQALDWLNEHRVDILLTDVVMPRMTGPELASQVLEGHPGLPVIFVSGHAEDFLNEQKLPKNCHFLAKPFEPSALSELLYLVTRNDWEKEAVEASFSSG